MRRLRSRRLPTVCSLYHSVGLHDPDNEFYPTDTGHNREQIQPATIRCLVDNGYLNDELGFVEVSGRVSNSLKMVYPCLTQCRMS